MKAEKRNKYLFLGFVLVLAVIRQVLVYNLPIYAISDGTHDDWLMVCLAEHLRNGTWLGSYGNLTLVKGIGYPAFLAAVNLLPFGYLSMSSLAYTVSCLCLVYGVKPVFRTRKSLAVLYTVLLFSPVAASLFTFQRIYRNSISAAQVLLMIGCFVGLYFRREEKLGRQLPWMAGAAAGLVSFYYTREDAIWILPFVLVVTAVYIGTVIYRFGRFNKKDALMRVVLVLMPLFLMIMAGKTIGFLNQHYYGTSVVNELGGGSFAQMMKTIYSVKDTEEPEQTTVSRKKLEQLYENSPTLATVQEEMDAELAIWCGDEEYSKVWEVKDGWFFWILRDAMSDAGYFATPQTMETFCDNVTAELEGAQLGNALEKQATMPSALMSPWREGYFEKTLAAMWELHTFANSYEGLHTMAAYSVDDNMGGIGRFEKITKNDAFCYENGKAEISGWFAYPTPVTLTVRDEDGSIVKTFKLQESADVTAYLQSQGRSAAESDRCRFNFTVENDEYEDSLTLVGVDASGKEVLSYPLRSNAEGFDDGVAILKLDYCYILPNNNDLVSAVAWKINVLNTIKAAYAFTGPWLWIAGVLCWLYVTIRMLAGIRKGQRHMDIWLVLSALLCSYLVLLGGIGYTHVSAFDAINPAYLSAAYPIIAAFWCLGVLKVMEDVVEWRKLR